MKEKAKFAVKEGGGNVFPTSGSRPPNGNSSGSGARAPVQRVVHWGEDLIDGDLAVMVRIGGLAVEQRRVAQGDVHHGQDFSNGDTPISPLARTPARWLAGYAPKARRNNGIDTIWMPW